MLRRRAQLDVRHRYIVVTGCDSGFGLGVAEKLIARGARVIAFCFTSEGAKAALQAGAVRAPCLDLKNEQALADVAHDVEIACNGELWGLVHCAGIALPGFIDYQPLSFYREVMDLNFFAPVLDRPA